MRAYDVQWSGLCIRASHQYCTEAMSKVGCNSSPILTWKIISNCEVLCYNECFSDHGNCLADFGRLECLILSNQGFSALGKANQSHMVACLQTWSHACRLHACSTWPLLFFPRTGLLVFPLGTLASQDVVLRIKGKVTDASRTLARDAL